MNTKQKGNLTELQCLTAFVKNGCAVSIPYGDCYQYDFIADVDGQLIKVQVKTSAMKDENAIEFSCRSTYMNSKGAINVRYNAKNVDYFATYWNEQCYIVPFKECSVTKILRFAPTKSGQIKGVTFAEDYTIEKQLNILKEKITKY